MARTASRVEEILTQIDALSPVERANLLAQALVRSGARPDWSVLRDIQQNLKTQDPETLDRAADEGAREARRSRD
jgi:hypothetical protein